MCASHWFTCRRSMCGKSGRRWASAKRSSRPSSAFRRPPWGTGSSSRPDAPARVLLAVIAKHPEAVEDVLRKASWFAACRHDVKTTSDTASSRPPRRWRSGRQRNGYTAFKIAKFAHVKEWLLIRPVSPVFAVDRRLLRMPSLYWPEPKISESHQGGGSLAAVTSAMNCRNTAPAAPGFRSPACSLW